MAQRRIVLNSKYQNEADEILEVTGIDNLSSLFTAFLTRYGEHFKTTWRHNPPHCKYSTGEVQLEAITLPVALEPQIEQSASPPPFPEF